MNRNFPLRNIQYLPIILASTCFTLAFFTIFRYTMPAADDFNNAVDFMTLGFKGAFLKYFLLWSGRYTQNTLFTLFSPLSYGSITGYKVATFIWFCLFIYSIYYLISQFGLSFLPRWQRLLAVFVFFIVYYYNLPDPASQFFWLNSVCDYLTGSIAFILILGLLASSAKQFSVNKGIALAALVIFAQGSNEITAIYVCATIFFVLFLQFLTKRKINTWLGALFLLSAVCLLISFLAPGNFERTKVINEMWEGPPHKFNFIWALKKSALFSTTLIFTSLKSIPLLTATLLFFALIRDRINEHINLPHYQLLARHALLITLFVVGCIFIGFFFQAFIIGYMPPQQRTLNVIYCFLIVGWFIVSLSWILFLKQRLSYSFSVLNPLLILVLNMMFILSAFSYDLNKWKIDSQNMEAMSDLFSHKLYNYNKEVAQRFNYMANFHQKGLCVVKTLSTMPRTVFHFDLQTDPGEYINQSQSQFFHVDSIKAVK